MLRIGNMNRIKQLDGSVKFNQLGWVQDERDRLKEKDYLFGMGKE